MAALEFLEWSRMSIANFGEPFKEENKRELNSMELRVKDAALVTLLEYFNSDDDGDEAPAATEGGAPDPNAPIPVPK